jgi:D-alanyl-lipoteichoic acid acyltransferase DltB (MBOAT superfamily)
VTQGWYFTIRKINLKKKLTLGEYVKRRNGVPLGAAGSLSNNLYRSFGAGSFQGFWQVWNPVWGYYLGRLVFVPLKNYLPAAIALLITFGVSGAVHDLAVMAVRWKPFFFFTPWFILLGLMVLVSKKLRFNYKEYSWYLRTCINLCLIVSCLLLAILSRVCFA